MTEIRQAGAADDPRPAHRGPRRRDVERDRQGRRPDAAQGRGDGADRRVRRRQVDRRASPPWASPATAAGSPAAGRTSTASSSSSAPEALRRGLRGRRIAYVAQSAAASFNPAHRLIDQYCEAPGPARRHAARRGRARRGRALPPHAAAEPGRDRLPLPAPGLRRPAAAGDDRDGDGLPAGPHHLRRADHRARRDDPDRGAVGDPRHRRAVRHRRALHHPRPGGRGADGRPHQGALPRRGGRGGRHPHACSPPRARTTPSRSGRSAATRAPSSRRRRRAETPVVSVRRASPPPTVRCRCCTTSASTSTAAAPSRWSASRARASRPPRGSSPACCRRSRGDMRFNGQPLPPDYRSRSKDQLRQAQMIYQMADTALNPKHRIREIVGRPVEFYLGLHGQDSSTRASASS